MWDQNKIRRPPQYNLYSIISESMHTVPKSDEASAHCPNLMLAYTVMDNPHFVRLAMVHTHLQVIGLNVAIYSM